MLIQATDIGHHTGGAQKPDWAFWTVMLSLFYQTSSVLFSWFIGVQEGPHKERAGFHLLTIDILQTHFSLWGDSKEIQKSTSASFPQPWTICTKATNLCPCN